MRRERHTQRAEDETRQDKTAAAIAFDAWREVESRTEREYGGGWGCVQPVVVHGC